MLVQPVSVNAITDIDEKCSKQAYEIGYDLNETNKNVMNALAQLEADCIYSAMMSQEAKCLVWWYDTGIRLPNWCWYHRTLQISQITWQKEILLTINALIWIF